MQHRCNRFRLILSILLVQPGGFVLTRLTAACVATLAGVSLLASPGAPAPLDAAQTDLDTDERVPQKREGGRSAPRLWVDLAA